ncbi:MAG: hypothetical protein ACH344_11470, partial [Yersinia sp. (in: enterobacteria)]
SHYADNLLTGQKAVQQGTPRFEDIQTKANVADLAQNNNFDPNIAFALHGTESDYGKNIPPSARLKDDFQTDPKYRDAGFTDDSLQSSMHNAVKIWNENSATLATSLGRTPTVAENYLAYNQGGAGAHALLTAAPTDTAMGALSKIMPADEARKHVLQNGGTGTQSAADFSQQIQDRFQNHYDAQKVTDTANAPAAIRNQANVQLPAIQPSTDPHGYFKQVESNYPAATASADLIPDEKIRDAVQKNLKNTYETAKRDNDIWKNQQADVVGKYAEDQRFTTMDEIPASVKNNLRDAGQLGALERQLNDKRDPKKDNTYGDGFLRTMELLASDDKTDAITDLAGLQQAYGDNTDLHSSGFKALKGMVNNVGSADGKAVIASQYQFLSSLHDKMVAGDSDVQGKKNFETALPQFFSAYSKAAAGGGDVSDVLSFDAGKKNSFINNLKLPTPAEMTNKKIQNTSSWLSSLFGGGNKPQVQFTPQEQVMADFADGRISKEEKDMRLKNLGVAPSAATPVPQPE